MENLTVQSDSEKIETLSKLISRNSVNLDKTIVLEKYVYLHDGILKFDDLEDMGLKVASDSLARLANSLHKTHVTALNLEFTKDEASKKLSLNRINYSTKNKARDFEAEFLNAIDYCFGDVSVFKSDDLDFSIGKLIDSLSLGGFLEEDIEAEFRNVILGNDYNVLMMYLQNILSDKTINIDNFDIFYPLIIKYFDLIVLPDIFKRHFIKGSNFSLVEIDITNNRKIHPDTKLACEIINQNKDKYIGISHLCCVYCAMFLDSYGFDFRGRSPKFEKHWKLSPNVDLNAENHINFMAKVDLLNNQVNFNPPAYSNNYFKNRTLDNCIKTCIIVSDDICHYFKYYESNNFNSYNFMLSNLDTKEKVINFIKNLRKKISCDCVEV